MNVLGGLPDTYKLEQEAKAAAEERLTGMLSNPATVGAARFSGSAPLPAPSADAELDAPDRTRGQSTVQYFTSKGLPAVMGAGIAANLYAESGISPNPKGSNDGGAAYGSFQAHEAYQRSFQEHMGKPIQGSSLQDQYDFLHWDLTQGPDKATGDRMMAAKTPEEAAKIFMLGIERPKDQSGQAVADRQAIARQIAGGTFKPAPGAAVAGDQQTAGVPAGAAPPSPLGTDDYLAQVRDAATKVFTGPDGTVDYGAVERTVKSVEFNIKRDDAGQATALEGQAKDAVSYLESGGDPSKVAVTPEQIRAAIPGPRGEAAATTLEAATDYNAAVKQLSTASEDQVQAILKQHEPTGPEGFDLKAGEYGALVKAAQDRHGAIYGDGKTPGDPVGYLESVLPDLNGAFAKASAPNATAADFDAYVKRLNGAYGALGIPASAQRILPNAIARSIVGNLETQQPRQALGMLLGVQKLAGGHWPQVYGELARSGLSSGYQTALVVGGYSASDAQVITAAMQKDAEAKASGKDPMAKQAEGVTYQGKSVTTLVDKAISDNTSLWSLRTSLAVAGRGGVDQFTGVQDAVRQTALYLYLSGLHDPAAAAAARAKPAW